MLSKMSTRSTPASSIIVSTKAARKPTTGRPLHLHGSPANHDAITVGALQQRLCMRHRNDIAIADDRYAQQLTRACGEVPVRQPLVYLALGARVQSDEGGASLRARQAAAAVDGMHDARIGMPYSNTEVNENTKSESAA